MSVRAEHHDTGVRKGASHPRWTEIVNSLSSPLASRGRQRLSVLPIERVKIRHLEEQVATMPRKVGSRVTPGRRGVRRSPSSD